MKSATAAALFALCCIMSSQAAAQGAPAQLRGKSVIASWMEERMQRREGTAEFTPRSIGHQLSAYVSTEGRVFARKAVSTTGGRGGRSRTANADSVGESGARQKAHIQGRTLIFTNQLGGGARMARIEFDPDFSTCTANVIVGRENGVGTARGRSLISGAALEIKSAQVTNTSCSIRSGNVFGE